MGFWQCNGDRMLDQLLTSQQFKDWTIAEDKDAYRNAPIYQRAFLCFWVHLYAVDDDSRRNPLPKLKCLAEKLVCQRRHMTDRQLSELPPANPLGFFHCLIAGFRDPARINQKRFSSCRQRHSFPFSLEQVNSELALQVLNLLAEGRLRHA